MVDNAYDDFARKFRLQELAVAHDDHWIVSVRPAQATAGSLVVSSATAKKNLSDLSEDDGASLARWLGIIERLSRDELGAVRVNVLCLMMRDPIVHFHVLPRYDRDLDRYGVTWSDPDWPGPPVNLGADAPDALLAQIAEHLAQALVWVSDSGSTAPTGGGSGGSPSGDEPPRRMSG